MHVYVCVDVVYGPFVSAWSYYVYIYDYDSLFLFSCNELAVATNGELSHKNMLLLLELGWAMVKWEVRGRFSVLLLAIGRYMNNNSKNTYNINGQLWCT